MATTTTMATTATTTLSMHRVFGAHAQVDAIAATTTSDGKDVPLLAVAQSHLEGNQWGGIVSLFDATSAEQRCAFQLAAGVSSLAWCGADRELLALACDNGDVQLVRLVHLDGDVAFAPQSGASTPSSRSADDDAANDGDGDDSAAPARASTSFGHDDIATCVSASLLESSRIATSSWDLTVKLWDISSMDKTLAMLDGHTDLVWSVAMNPLTAHVLASASQDCTVQLWDARQPTDAVQALSVRSPALVLDWHPHRETLFSVGLEDGSVLTFDTRSAGAALLDATPHTGAVHALKYSRVHADLLASGGDDANVYTRNGAQPSCNITLSSSSSSDDDGASSERMRHRDYVRALEWFQAPGSAFGGSSDDHTPVLATGCWDQAVRTWRVEQQ